VQHIIALSRTAVIVRHWFEIDLDDSSMEHGVRIELRELAIAPRRGSESASQLVTADRPMWRDPPGTFGVAHFHPYFAGNEPSPRVFDPQLSASPWAWLAGQFTALGATGGRPRWELPPADADELASLAGPIAALAQQFGPDRCASAAECFALTRDVRGAVQLMLAQLRQPERLDAAWVAPWREAG
jgi:hypothetical protein